MTLFFKIFLKNNLEKSPPPPPNAPPNQDHAIFPASRPPTPAVPQPSFQVSPKQSAPQHLQAQQGRAKGALLHVEISKTDSSNLLTNRYFRMVSTTETERRKKLCPINLLEMFLHQEWIQKQVCPTERGSASSDQGLRRQFSVLRTAWKEGSHIPDGSQEETCSAVNSKKTTLQNKTQPQKHVRYNFHSQQKLKMHLTPCLPLGYTEKRVTGWA